MNKVQVQTTTTFRKIYDAYYHSDNRVIINQGGTSSGKTWAILQLLFAIAVSSPVPLIISVVSYALPHLRLGAMRDFDNILLSAGLIPDKHKNKTENFYRINQSIIEFFGTDNLSKVVGPRRNILFVNEANHIKHEIYQQLSVRTKERIFIDYNPVSEFWVHTDTIPNGNCTFLKTTYLDNELLDPRIVKEIESRKHNENWWRVYGLGEIGILEGVIFPAWEYGSFDDTLSFGFGLDFGFTNDPDAMGKIAINEKIKTFYVHECFYQSGQLPSELSDNIGNYAGRNDLIVADSADPRMIATLEKKYNIRGVKKTGQVGEWLRLMQDYKWIVTESSFNFGKELNNYTWSDKRAGIPIDAWNHLIDGSRYYFMNKNQIRPTTKAY